MSNPTTLQELADSLAASAEAARSRGQEMTGSLHAVREGGYRDALLDTRATVLAMIASGREVIRTVHVHIPEGAECAECGRNDVVGQVGPYFYCTRHEAQVTALNDAGDSWPTSVEALRQAKRPVCDECGGTGYRDGQITGNERCSHCNGAGVL